MTDNLHRPEYAAEGFEPGPILESLIAHNVDFVLIGGMAGMAHGSAYPSFDVDIVYSRKRDNLDRLAASLRDLGATLRGAPPDLPLQLDGKMLENGWTFTFATAHGSFDILAQPDGAPKYDSLRAAAERKLVEGVLVDVCSLDHLIAMKLAAGRQKDHIMVTEYIELAEEIAKER